MSNKHMREHLMSIVKQIKKTISLDMIPGSGRSPGEGNGNPLQYSCLENSMDRPRGRKESNTTEQSTLHFSDTY